MLGLLLIYFIGKYFYDLAKSFNKNKWLFAILGVICYYFGTFVFGVLIAIIDDLFSLYFLASINDVVLGLIALPFGVLSCVAFYFILKKVWQKKKLVNPTVIDDIEL